MVQLTDTLTLDRDARICADGSLVAEVFAARTGMQDYLGREVDPGNSHGLRDKDIVKVYRPESEVFKRDSLATYAAAPVTLDHPSVEVTADNWRDYGRGEINGDVARDGERVRVPIIVRDAAAVKAATTTHKQLSMGYATDLVFPQDGKHPDGTVCDAYQTNLRINHIALVRAARGGPELRVVDERQPLTNDRKDGTMPHTLIVDGLQVPNVSDEAKACIEKLQGVVTTKDTQIGTLTADLATATTTIETRDGEIVALKAKLVDAEVTPEKLQQLADARADVVGRAKMLKADIVTDGKADAEIRKEAVTAKIGDEAANLTDVAIEGAFIALTKDAQTDPVRDALRNGLPIADADKVVTDARAAMIADLKGIAPDKIAA